MSTDSATKLVPVVGMGLTVTLYTDRITFTIVSVSASGKSFKATRDTVERIDTNGMSDSQDYKYTPNPQGEVMEFRLGHKTGYYKCKLGKASLGVRRYYHDYSF